MNASESSAVGHTSMGCPTRNADVASNRCGGEVMEPRQLARHGRANVRLVGVAERPCVEPLLPDHKPAPAERARRRKPGGRKFRLNALHLVQVRLVDEQLVDLHRDATGWHATRRTRRRRSPRSGRSRQHAGRARAPGHGSHRRRACRGRRARSASRDTAASTRRLHPQVADPQASGIASRCGGRCRDSTAASRGVHDAIAADPDARAFRNVCRPARLVVSACEPVERPEDRTFLGLTAGVPVSPMTTS
jgi:hypothetical protein